MHITGKLAVVAVTLALAGGATTAVAQDRPPAPAAAEAALAQAIALQIREMAGEMDAAYRGARGDRDRAQRDMEAVAARYQPLFDAHAATLRDLLAPNIAAATDEAERERMLAGAQQAEANLRELPARMPALMFDTQARVDRASREAAIAGALAGVFMAR